MIASLLIAFLCGLLVDFLHVFHTKSVVATNRFRAGTVSVISTLVGCLVWKQVMCEPQMSGFLTILAYAFGSGFGTICSFKWWLR